MCIRVLVVDDHEMVRTGLAAFIRANKNLELVGEAAKGAEAVHLCAQLQPDVVVMDMMLPDIAGPIVIRSITGNSETIQIIALTSFSDEALVQAALQAGAISYLYKTVSGTQLVQAICSAYEGRATLAPEALQALIHSQLQARKPGYDLTAREQEVLELMTKGMNNLQIADHLSVSRWTIKAHVGSILSKLGVTNRTEAANLALQQALTTI